MPVVIERIDARTGELFAEHAVLHAVKDPSGHRFLVLIGAFVNGAAITHLSRLGKLVDEEGGWLAFEETVNENGAWVGRDELLRFQRLLERTWR